MTQLINHARAAAVETLRTGYPRSNPHPPLTENHRRWRSAYEAWLIWLERKEAVHA